MNYFTLATNQHPSPAKPGCMDDRFRGFRPFFNWLFGWQICGFRAEGVLHCQVMRVACFFSCMVRVWEWVCVCVCLWEREREREGRSYPFEIFIFLVFIKFFQCLSQSSSSSSFCLQHTSKKINISFFSVSKHKS